ncbi:zinc finger protein [Homalodisca vitripennis]|nr:zinc finger protein [Homalodisca vitripennis]
MTKRLRSHGSEIDRQFNDDLALSDSDLEVSDNEDADIGFDEDELESSFDDDTDDDPTCESETPRRIPTGRPRPNTNTSTTEQTRPIGQGRPVFSSSDSEDDSNDLIYANQHQYVWKKINNTSTRPLTHNFQYMECSGPKHCPPLNASAIDYFNLFFTHSLLSLFSRETNRYSEQLLAKQDQLSPHSRLRAWVPTTVLEIKAFIITILNMGLIQKPTMKSYWTDCTNQSTPWFKRMFTRNRFEVLLSCFHMVDNTRLPKSNEPNYDPSQKFQPIIDHCNQTFPHFYVPHEQLSIDESIIGTKCQTKMMQYLPNKHHNRWGIKLWVLCDSVTNYCLSFYCYKGKSANPQEQNEVKEKGLAHVVVSKLLAIGNYLGKGFHLFTDNFYTSVPLMDWLYKNKTFMTGTVKRDRKHLPNEIKTKIDVGCSVYCQEKNTSLVALGYRQTRSQKNPVLLLSSKPQISDVHSERRRHGRVTSEKKPAIVESYCKYMGGIDTLDMMLYTYLDGRRSMKYWRKATFNIFSRMVLNSYILYKTNCKINNVRPIERYPFIASIVASVTEEWLGEQHLHEAASSNQALGVVTLPGTNQKTCWVCTPKGKDYKTGRKRSRTVCVRCNEGCHGTCFAKHICK